MEKCLICGLECKTIKSLSRHVNITHGVTSEEYYIKYLGNVQHKCTCGNHCTFISIGKGYHQFCSAKCSVNDLTVKQKKDATCIKKYGVVDPNTLDIIKTKRKETSMKKYGTVTPLLNDAVKEKTHKTLMETYGVDNVFKSDIIKNKIKNTCNVLYNVDYNTQREDVKKNRINTNIIKYNVSHPMKSSQVMEKRKITCKSKYGVDVAASSDIVKNNIITSNINKYGVSTYFKTEAFKQSNILYYKNKAHLKYDSLFNAYDCNLIDSSLHKFTYRCNICENLMTESSLFVTRCRMNKYITPCSVCVPKPIYSSFKEIAVGEYIKSLLSCEVIFNTRDVITPYELDIYIPSHNIAIEFNGLYHHNELYKSSDYHLNKTIMCAEKSIKLIHIYEDDWKYKQDIVKSRLKSLFGNTTKIYARKCYIEELSNKQAIEFLDDNHIQGHCVSKYRYGLFFDGQLVSIMTFGKSRFESNTIELLRYCNKLNTTVVGGASKLFKYFIKTNAINRIVSYADRSWSNGNMYEKIGFTFNSTTLPNYYYVVGDIRENRIKYQKHKLVKCGYDSNKTEHEIMLDRGLYRIYDSGNLKYIWNR